MPIGAKIYTKINRPDPALVARFADKPVANINDVIGRNNCLGSKLHRYNKTELIGTAFTIKAPIGEGMLMHYALDVAQAGDVIIFDAGGCEERAMCGEGMMLYARQKGIKGFIVNGAIRDSEAAAQFDDFGIWALGANPNAQRQANAGYINVPISIGGVIIYPGDIVRGDADGIVVVRPDEAAAVIDKLDAFAEKDREKMRRSADGTVDRTWVAKFFEDKPFEVFDTTWDGN